MGIRGVGVRFCRSLAPAEEARKAEQTEQEIEKPCGTEGRITERYPLYHRRRGSEDIIMSRVARLSYLALPRWTKRCWIASRCERSMDKTLCAQKLLSLQEISAGPCNNGNDGRTRGGRLTYKLDDRLPLRRIQSLDLVGCKR